MVFMGFFGVSLLPVLLFHLLPHATSLELATSTPLSTDLTSGLEFISFDLYLQFTDQDHVPELNGTADHLRLAHDVYWGIINLTSKAESEKHVAYFQSFLSHRQDHDLHVMLAFVINSSDGWIPTSDMFKNRLIIILESVAEIVQVDQYPTSAPSTVLASTERSVVTSPTSSAASSLFSGATPTYTTLQGSDASSYSSQASDRTTTTEEPAVLSDDVVFHGTSGAEYNHPALSYLLLLCLTFIWSNYY